ncbi:alpha-D-ribose 1-methylphosphonate 5-phosphate C-P lyase [Rhodovulum iodosum]|uniref:Alpha-D-ribose 1-methylphosphonate 5-phosphate C-P lyase n=1 Tax=Rhodovulum iodosum TaxID=68291 RepID=A0ABV3XQC3_9RHOB|nr:alpha-D-ribose 1-methylphosphonate 5-phosphate C-P-lyase PhnJ [Rhodovulum robiginosum]RSK35800.1 carbon-phosphorus lyase [Rhodovulum robiginosum]
MTHAPRRYNFGYLDEGTKRMVRRALLKAVAIPGYQVPFGSREMPIPYGWGTGGMQITASLITPGDRLKVIDQGADDTTNAVNIRRFFAKVAGTATTEATAEATLIQTRHRIPETPLREGQTLVLQVPQPEPMRRLEPRETECRKIHAWGEYGLMHLRLYESVAQTGRITINHSYPVLVNGRYVMSPTPIPRFDNPKMEFSAALMLFGAGRERRIYALPPYTSVKSLDFEDHPFTPQQFPDPCALCGARGVYQDEILLDDTGAKMFVCSDSDFCARRRAEGQTGPAPQT